MNIKHGCLLIVALMTGCSKPGDNNPAPEPPEPPPPPISEIPSDGSGELTSQTAVFEASQTYGAKKGLKRWTLVFETGTTNNSGARQLVKEKISRIQNIVSNGNCQIDAKQPADDIDFSDGAAALFPRMKVKIEGPNCPMEVMLDMTVVSDNRDPHEICELTPQTKICKFLAQVKMIYRVVDDNISKELRLKSGEINMLFKVEQKFLRNSWTTQDPENMSMKGKTDFDFKAIDFSQKAYAVTGSQQFDVKMSLPTSGDPDRPAQQIATVEENMTFKNDSTKNSSTFSARMSLKNGKNTSENYMIDGVAVAAEKYAIEREKFTNSMLSFGKKEGSVRNEPPNPIPNFGRLQ